MGPNHHRMSVTRIAIFMGNKPMDHPWPRSLVDYSLDFENCREYLCGFDSLRVFKSFAFTTTVSANCMKNTLSAISRICETYI